MKNIFFKLPNLKEYLELNEYTSSVSQVYDKNPNFINIQQIEIEDGYVCTKITCQTDKITKWVHQPNREEDLLIFCFWIETKPSKIDHAQSHFLNILHIKTHFSFLLNANSLYHGYMLCLSKAWILKNIESSLIRNYFNQFRNYSVKTLYFEKNDIMELAKIKNFRKWQLQANTWLLMGLIFEKIMFDIQNEKIIFKSIDESTAITTLTTYIHNNISRKEINVSQLINTVNLSTKTFKEATGMSIREYIRDARMIKTSELLKEDEYSIKEIFERVGFSDDLKLRQFINVFKDKFGVSPSEYKSIQKQGQH